jgi:lipopolysaccharide export system protein LptA
MIPLSVILSGLILAAPPDTSQPYQVSANSMKVQLVGSDRVTWLKGEVEIVHGPTVIRGDSARVSSLQEKALIWGAVRITDQSASLSGREAVYFKKLGRSVLYGRPRLHDQGWTLEADSLVHLKELARSFAFGNIVMEDSAARNRIEGSYGEYWHQTSYGLLTGRPRFVLVEGNGRVSSITADRMEVMQARQTAIATGSVMFAGDSLWASAGRMSYFRDQGRILLEDRPRAWREDADLTGRTMELGFDGDSLRSAVARDSAVLRQFLAGTADTDLVRCDSLLVEFSGGKISYARAQGSAWSRYHQTDQGRTSGWNIAAGREMEFFFVQGRIDRLSVGRPARGAYFGKEQP